MIRRDESVTKPAGESDPGTKFRALVRRWKKDTEADSSIARMVRHPAYRQIIEMGEAAVPLLLAELKREPDFWFVALREITGVNPAPPEAAGKVELLAQSWIEWGREKGYIE